MTEQEKTKLQELISRGNLKEAIRLLLAMDLKEDKKQAVRSISSQYNQIRKQKRLGTLADDQLTIKENQLITSLLELIDHPEGVPIPKPQNINPISAGSIGGFPIPVLIGTLVVLIGMTAIFWNSFYRSTPTERLQLTVFVTDAKGNVVLENSGRLNIPLGNRSLNEVIGANGRTNFGDITADTKGDSIRIGMDAEGWEIADGKNTFVFTGEPIRLIVQPDERLGLIKGSVRSFDEREFIAGALIRINADTIVRTDSLGFFRILLPPHMRVKRLIDTYTLSISKEGYLPSKQLFTPNTSDAEIKLERE